MYLNLRIKNWCKKSVNQKFDLSYMYILKSILFLSNFVSIKFLIKQNIVIYMDNILTSLMKNIAYEFGIN